MNGFKYDLWDEVIVQHGNLTGRAIIKECRTMYQSPEIIYRAEFGLDLTEDFYEQNYDDDCVSYIVGAVVSLPETPDLLKSED